MDKFGNVVGYWFRDETRTDADGYYASDISDTTGTWNYTAGTTLSGTWRNDDGSGEGTWMSTIDNPYNFIDSTPEPLANEGEQCGRITGWLPEVQQEVECVSGLICRGVQDTTGTAADSVNGYVLRCFYELQQDDFDGKWYGRDGVTGYWNLNDASAEHDGSWISEDKAHTGYWNYYDSNDLEGTWGFDDLSQNGTWATDASDFTIKFDTTPVSNDTCVDLDIYYTDLTDRIGNDCSFYY